MDDRWLQVHVHEVSNLSARGGQTRFLCISRLNNMRVRSCEDTEVVRVGVVGLVSWTSVKGVLDA